MLVLILAIGCAAMRPSADSPVVKTERINWCGPNWETAFSPTEAVQKVEDTCIRPGRYTQRFHPTAAQWAAVQSALESNGFSTLPEEITTPPDSQGRITIVTDDPDSCISFAGRRVCGEEHPLNHTPEGERFLQIWSALTAIAPEPVH
jgi:hypothetical protein